MAIPLQSTREEILRTWASEALIRSCVAELDARFGCIDGCKVAIEPGRSSRLCQVVIEVDLSGDLLVVRGAPDDRVSREQLDHSIRAAFAALQRKLEDYVRFHREEPEAHARHFR